MITGRCLPGDSVVERGKHEHRPERGAPGIGGEGLEIPVQAAGLAQRADAGIEVDVGVIVVKAVVQRRQAESTGQESEEQLLPPRIPPAAAIPHFCVRATAT